MSLSCLLSPTAVSEAAVAWLKEDIPSFDVAGYVVGEVLEEAQIYFKDDGVLAGVPFANAVIAILGCSVHWLVEEGTYVCGRESKVVIGRVSGKCCSVLQAERTVLNVLTRASGIATLAREAKQLAVDAGWTGSVAGTRKTTPGFRLVEKYAMSVGGISTHRYDLSQMVMLKDNHIWSAGSIPKAVGKARSAAGFSLKIEVECQNEEEALLAASAGADVVMLDNHAPEQLAIAASRVKAAFPHLTIEASGGITLANMQRYMLPEVDVISSSLFTQGHKCVDISMKILRDVENYCGLQSTPSQHYRVGFPTGTPPPHGFPAIVIVHGGFWKHKYHMDNSAIEQVAPFFRLQGFVTCEIEYRRIGAPSPEDEGGVFESAEDVNQALAHFLSRDRRFAALVDPSRVVALGHSAGGQLALIINKTARLAGVVALAPVCDLREADRRGLSDDGTAVQKYLKGNDLQVPGIWENPLADLPLASSAPILVVAGEMDTDVPADYVEAAFKDAGPEAAISRVQYLWLKGADHYQMVNPQSSGFLAIVEKMKTLFPALW